MSNKKVNVQRTNTAQIWVLAVFGNDFDTDRKSMFGRGNDPKTTGPVNHVSSYTAFVHTVDTNFMLNLFTQSFCAKVGSLAGKIQPIIYSLRDKNFTITTKMKNNEQQNIDFRGKK